MRECVAGEPGVIVGYDRKGYAEIYWPDLYAEMGKNTFHPLDNLVVDEAFKVEQLDIAFEEIAA